MTISMVCFSARGECRSRLRDFEPAVFTRARMKPLPSASFSSFRCSPLRSRTTGAMTWSLAVGESVDSVRDHHLALRVEISVKHTRRRGVPSRAMRRRRWSEESP